MLTDTGDIQTSLSMQAISTSVAIPTSVAPTLLLLCENRLTESPLYIAGVCDIKKRCNRGFDFEAIAERLEAHMEFSCNF